MSFDVAGVNQSRWERNTYRESIIAQIARLVTWSDLILPPVAVCCAVLLVYEYCKPVRYLSDRT